MFRGSTRRITTTGRRRGSRGVLDAKRRPVKLTVLHDCGMLSLPIPPISIRQFSLNYGVAV